MSELYMGVTSPKDEIQGTLLTREQIREISDRISESFSKAVSEQLTKSIEEYSKKNKEKDMK